jgi:hypothetical protein
MQHLYKMTDHMGMLQFAVYTVPNLDSGYTLDDNVRALIACSWLIERKFTKKMQTLIHIYLAFMKRCQRKDGSFVNYIGYTDKLPTGQNNLEDLEDSQSRAMWGLSEVMNNKMLSAKVRDQAQKMYLLSLEKGSKLTHLRAKAYAIKSFALSYQIMPERRQDLLDYMKTYSDSLIDGLKQNSYKSWYWFEKDLNYNNALLSESLLISGKCLDNSEYTSKGLQALEFLIGKTFSPDMYMPIGHSHWYTNNGKRSQYDQQPEDPTSMILALSCAYDYTHNDEYKNLARKCFSWFLGNNSLDKPLYDEKSGGCCDGLHPDRVNLNQGAESLVSYLMSNYTVSELH